MNESEREAREEGESGGRRWGRKRSDERGRTGNTKRRKEMINSKRSIVGKRDGRRNSRGE